MKMLMWNRLENLRLSWASRMQTKIPVKLYEASYSNVDLEQAIIIEHEAAKGGRAGDGDIRVSEWPLSWYQRQGLERGYRSYNSTKWYVSDN